MSRDEQPDTPLISVAGLADLIETGEVRVCDVRWYLSDASRGRSEYLEAHIPGAVFVDLDTQLSARKGPGRHPLPDPVRFAATLGRLGIGPSTPVVAYDSAGGAIAARMWWMLRRLGHSAVWVLDGGWQAWVESGRPTASHDVEVEPRPYPVLMKHWPTTITAAEITAGEDLILIDARAAERYTGEVENVDARPGHIPGAINIPHAGNLGGDGRHLPPEVLAERFAGVGPEPIAYCGSGVTACANILAMELAGIRGARLYPGSWSDWAADPELPAELGRP